MDKFKREITGSFYTPQIWVELSQKYLADVLGADWQDEYYVWDCAAGTGNLLTGLTNKRRIFASTLDRQDVDVMKDRIQNGANLMEDNVFQFDFLNDSFEKLPKNLQEIINDPEKRKKLIIYINPPYAEATSTRTVMGTGKHKPKITTENFVYTKYSKELGKASNELFTLFLIRIYHEIQGCTIANFSKIKNLQSLNFDIFRKSFKAKLKKLFLMPADTFDNVTGQFPIGFFIWDTHTQEFFEHILADIYNKNGVYLTQKNIYSHDDLKKRINDWIKQFKNISEDKIGVLNYVGNDFQQQNIVYIELNRTTQAHLSVLNITFRNLIPISVYYAVRHCIKATWLNDRDQFLFPNESWEKGTEFQNDCLTYTLFTNNIQAKHGTNHWIPFTEDEVNARQEFASHFMIKFIKGKLKQEGNGTLLETEKQRTTPLEFSAEAQAVFEAGKKLWQYYHSQINQLPLPTIRQEHINASLYDIREYFQGRNEKGKMHHKSQDDTYTELIGILRATLTILAQKIEPKVYEYGFLRR